MSIKNFSEKKLNLQTTTKLRIKNVLMLSVLINKICKIFNVTKKSTKSLIINRRYIEKKRNNCKKAKLTFQIKKKLEKDIRGKQGIGIKKVERKYNISSRTIRRWLKTQPWGKYKVLKIKPYLSPKNIKDRQKLFIIE